MLLMYTSAFNWRYVYVQKRKLSPIYTLMLALCLVFLSLLGIYLAFWLLNPLLSSLALCVLSETEPRHLSHRL